MMDDKMWCNCDVFFFFLVVVVVDSKLVLDEYVKDFIYILILVDLFFKMNFANFIFEKF